MTSDGHKDFFVQRNVLISSQTNVATDQGDNYRYILGSRVINGLPGLFNDLFLAGLFCTEVGQKEVAQRMDRHALLPTKVHGTRILGRGIDCLIAQGLRATYETLKVKLA